MASKVSLEEHLHDAKKGVAVMFAAMIQVLAETDPAIKEKFVERLNEAYALVRHDNSLAIDRLELINWTCELITGWSSVTGQGLPFLS